MHLAIEAVGVKHSGGAVVLHDVVSAALRSKTISKLTIFCSPRATRRFDFPSDSRLVLSERVAEEKSLWGRMLWITAGIQSEIDRLGPDVLLCMSAVGTSRVPTAAFVQQSLMFCPEALALCDWKTRLRIRVISAQMKKSCSRAALVIAQTTTMAEWIGHSFGISPGRLTVIEPWGDYIGIDLSLASDLSAMKNVPSDRRLLYVGNTSKYKNLEFLGHVMQAVRQRVPGATLFLTCPPDHPLCGYPGLVGLGYIAGRALRDAYQLCTAFITASLVESGNLTLVEAMSVGVPVIAARRPYAAEICRDAAQYFEPTDVQSASATVANVLENPDLRGRMANRGREIASAQQDQRPYDRLIAQLTQVAKVGEQYALDRGPSNCFQQDLPATRASRVSAALGALRGAGTQTEGPSDGQ